MRVVSLVASWNFLSIERTACEDLLRRRWLEATLRRITLPEPVIFTRLAIAVCVLSFCFMVFLSASARSDTKITMEHCVLPCSTEHKKRQFWFLEIEISVHCDSISIPQLLHRRRREAYFRSDPACGPYYTASSAKKSTGVDNIFGFSRT